MEIVLGILAALEAIVIIILVLNSNRSKQRMDSVVARAEQVKNRNMNVEDIIIDDRKDSQALLADSINVIKNNMQSFIEATKGNVVVLSDAIDVLSRGAEVNQIGSQKISESLSVVVGKVEEQLQLVKSSLNLIEENTSQLMEIDDSVKGIGGLLEESVQNCKSGMEHLVVYEGNVHMIAENLDKSQHILEDFSEKINEINEIGSFIVEISESLKLLALNASIEAARVGEAGSGFTVVAKEMSVMSDKTQEGIENINQILLSIVESSNMVTDCIRESAESFDEGRIHFNDVSNSLRIIDAQSETINREMGKILAKVDRITDNAKLSKDKANQAYQASEFITSGTQEIARVSGETAESSAQISGNVESLDSMLMGIQGLLRQFSTSVMPVKQRDGKKVKIAFITVCDNDFWYSVRRGAIYAQKELEAYNAEVRFIPFYHWEDTVNIPEIMDQLIAEDFDGFIFPGFMTGILEKTDGVFDLGKKVMCFNMDAPSGAKRNACFQPDVEEAGVVAGKEMAKALNKKGKVAVLAGDLKVQVNLLRTQGFKKQIASNKGMSVVDTIVVEEGEQSAYEKAMECLQKYPDLSGLYITTGAPLGAARAIEESGRDVKLVVFDHNDEIFRYIKKGIIAAAIGQDPFGQGHDPIVWMYNMIMDGVSIPSEIMKCRANVVDKGNVDSMIETQN